MNPNSNSTTLLDLPFGKINTPWLIFLLGILVMYTSTLINLFTSVWSTEEQSHGPLILMICIWLIARNWSTLTESSSQPSNKFGWLLFGFALLIYIIGRTQNILILEIGSLILIFSSALLLFQGFSGIKIMGFAIFFMFFLLPLPSSLVDALTQPMKMAVSYVASEILFHFGYPISRQGVMLQIGSYQLLVADACAGLHTLFSLEAMGLLYLNIVRHASIIRNIGLAVTIIPISFCANVIRVMALTLITYHYGDEVGQGFIHKFAGLVLFMTALVLIISADSLFRYLPARLGSEP